MKLSEFDKMFKLEFKHRTGLTFPYTFDKCCITLTNEIFNEALNMAIVEFHKRYYKNKTWKSYDW